MIKQRKGSVFIILEPAKTRIQNGLCPVCEKPKSEWKRRTDWYCCSVDCTNKFKEHFFYFGWNDLREKVLKRDNYTCLKCNTRYHASQLIGDHILPIALGGEEFDINNVQTLCLACNKEKTKIDIKKISIERKVPDTQKRLIEIAPQNLTHENTSKLDNKKTGDYL